MSLLKTAAVISLAVALMPSDKAQQEHLFERAAAAAQWTLTFCERNPVTCAKSGELWNVFLAKAELAARTAYAMAEQSSASPDARTSEFSIGARPRFEPARRGTLTPEDLAPVWRGRPGA